MLDDEMCKVIYKNVCDRIDELFGDDPKIGLIRTIEYRSAEAALMVLQEYEKVTQKDVQSPEASS